MCTQASGEAIYTLDHPHTREALWAAYVASDHPLARFDGVDPSKALQLPGVVAYISAEDIPEGGVNSCMGQEPVFAEGLVEWVGQPIGIVVAENRAAAERGAQLVKVGHPKSYVPAEWTVYLLDMAIMNGEVSARF